MERSVVLVKPDGVQRALIGEIIHRFERKGLKLVGIKMIALDDAILDEWYAHHKDKSFFVPLKLYMKSYPVVAMLWEGKDAVLTVRKMTGITLAREAEPGTIRGDLARDQGTKVMQNLVHGSDSPESAAREIQIFFPK